VVDNHLCSSCYSTTPLPCLRFFSERMEVYLLMIKLVYARILLLRKALSPFIALK
jgi:hypothetical protein